MGRKPRVAKDGQSARLDFTAELVNDALVSVVVGATLEAAFARVQADWPGFDQCSRCGPIGNDAVCLDFDGHAVIVLEAGATIETFVHEAVHAAACLCRSRRVPFTDANEEIVAYTVEWVVRRGWPFASTWRPSPTN